MNTTGKVRSGKPARRTVRRVRWGLLVFRFLTGRPLDGRRHSDATFWRRGSRRSGYPTYFITWDRWNLAAGWQRAAIRIVAAAIVLIVGLVIVV